MKMGKSGKKNIGQHSVQQRGKNFSKVKKKRSKAWREKQKLKACLRAAVGQIKDGTVAEVKGGDNSTDHVQPVKDTTQVPQNGPKKSGIKPNKDKHIKKRKHKVSEMNVDEKVIEVTQSAVKEESRKKRKRAKKKRAEQGESQRSVKDAGLSSGAKVSVETVVKLPRTGTDISANWKNLLKMMPELHGNRNKSKSSPKNKAADPGNSKTSAPDIWFDDVDEILLEKPGVPAECTTDKLVKDNCFKGLTKVVAMDCEMVGAGTGGEESMLARVSLVNQHGHCLYDKYVTPTETVTDYRTRFSGIRPCDLENADDFKAVQKEVSDMITGRILVGHAIHNDLQALLLDHPRKQIRDTSRYKPFRALFKGGAPSLKKLSERVLGVKVQEGEHNSVQDAQAAMRLYTMYRQQWEKDLKLGKKVTTAYKVNWEKSRQFQKRKGRHKKGRKRERENTS